MKTKSLKTSCLFPLLVTAASAQANPASPQAPSGTSDAVVTFYSNPVTVLGGLPGAKKGAFKGRLYDGQEELAFMEPNRFITFHLAPGPHVFAAGSWMGRGAYPPGHLSLELKPGQHYFVEGGVDALLVVRFSLKERTCAEAHEGRRSEPLPLEAKHLRSEGIPAAVKEMSFPACP